MATFKRTGVQEPKPLGTTGIRPPLVCGVEAAGSSPSTPELWGPGQAQVHGGSPMYLFPGTWEPQQAAKPDREQHGPPLMDGAGGGRARVGQQCCLEGSRSGSRLTPPQFLDQVCQRLVGPQVQGVFSPGFCRVFLRINISTKDLLSAWTHLYPKGKGLSGLQTAVTFIFTTAWERPPDGEAFIPLYIFPVTTHKSGSSLSLRR